MTEVLHEGDFLRLVRDEHWEYIQRLQATGAATILAVTAENEIVLVEQYRYPLKCNVLEMPAGVIGDEPEYAGEDILTCANRELEEETGFRAQSMSYLIKGPSSPGLTSELSNIVRAEGISKVGPGGGVGSENIVTHCVPLSQVESWLRGREAEGVLIDPKIYAGLFFVRGLISA